MCWLWCRNQFRQLRKAALPSKGEKEKAKARKSNCIVTDALHSTVMVLICQAQVISSKELTVVSST